MIVDCATLERQIQEAWNTSSKRCGLLVRRRIGFWHYGVALSDTLMIFLGPPSKVRVRGMGYFFIAPLCPSFAEVKDVSYLGKGEVIGNLMASPSAFHGKWKYCLRRWNCEHWARLVTSDDPASYQVKEAVFGIALWAGGRFRNTEASQVLAAKVQANHRFSGLN